MDITQNDLQYFQRLTGADIASFFNDAVSFFSNSYPQIVEYYSGNSKVITQGVFNDLKSLEVECNNILAVYYNLGNKLNNIKWWTILDYVEQIDSRIQTAKNINRWSKSSITQVAYDPIIQIPYILKPNQTLERVAQDVLGDTDPSDDWVDIALSNQLTEEEYSSKGGTQLHLGFPQVNRGISINSVVDIMIGTNIYGKDINRFFQFDEDEQDIAVLNPADTVYQAVYILANLRQNDNPDYPTEGLQSSVIAGTNRASLNFPIIDRQMSSTFATDDSLQNFNIIDIVINGIQLSINFTVETRLKEIIPSKTIV